jgi:ATP-binding cassette subfamily B protein
MKALLRILFKNHWKGIFLVFILTVIDVGAQLYVIEIIPLILDCIKTGLYNETFSMVDEVFVAILCSIISTLFISYLSNSISSSFALNLKEKLFSIVMNINTVDEYSKINFSGLMTRLIRGVDTEQSFVLVLLRGVLLLFVAAGWVIYSLIDLNILFAFVFTIFLFIYGFSFILKLNQSANEYFKVKKLNGKLNNLFRDNIVGLKTIKLFSKEKYSSDTFKKAADNAYKEGYKFQNSLNFPYVFMIVMHIAVILFVLWGLFIFDSNRGLAVEVFLSLLYLLYLINHINAINPFIDNYSLAYTSAIRIEEVLALEHTSDYPSKKEGDFKGIEFNNVSVNISDREILSDISFKIPQNSKNLVVGPVGAGKTSLIYSLIGAYKINSGSILINGENVESKSWDEKICLISDNLFLLKASVFENVRLGDESITRDDVVRACKDALFTKDLSFEVNEEGNNLSSDFKQRLSISRALVHDCEIYIFDNSFSQIESASKKIIKENIIKRLSGKIIIFIDNAFEDYSDMDNIIVMKNASIVDYGNHDYLIENCETYKSLINYSGGK